MTERPDPDRAALEKACLFLSQFEQRHLQDDNATRQLLESTSTFIRIATQAIRAQNPDTTQINEMVERFAPHVFSLLESDVMDL